MTLLLIWFVILCAACATVAVVLFRHIGAIAAVDVTAVARTHEKRTKDELAATRLVRRARDRAENFLTYAAPLVRLWQAAQQKFRDSANALADTYRTLEWKRTFQEWRAKSRHERRAFILRTLQEGDEARHAAQVDAAEKKYVDVIAVDPKNVTAYIGLGKTYFAAARYDEAIQSLTHVVETMNDLSPLAWAFLGRAHKAQGKYGEAVAAFERALALDDTLAKRWIDVGDCYRELGGLAEAIGAYKKAAVIEPTNPRVLDHLLEISIISGDKRQARETLLQLQAANPENQKLGEWEEKIREMA